MPFNIDLHSHTFFSGDGVSSPEENIAAAREKGLHGIAITDHNTCDAVTYLLEKGLMREDGLPVDNFLIIPGEHSMHVCNAPSPGATASIPIGRAIAEKAPAPALPARVAVSV